MGDGSAADGAGADLTAETGKRLGNKRHGGGRLRNGLVIATVLCVFPALILGALSWFLASARRQAAAEPAIFLAQSSEAVIARLGEPISAGWPVRGWLQAKNGEGAARLRIPVSGPKGSGVLEETAEQREKLWTACAVEFVAADGERLLLRAGNAGSCSGGR